MVLHGLVRRLAAGLLAAVCNLAPAQPAPAPAPANLSGRTAQAETVELEILRGQVVLVFFWSTDCPVCLDKLPELRRNLDGWRGKDFVVLAVNQDRSRRDLAEYERLLDGMLPPSPQMKVLWRRDPAHRDGFGELPLRVPTAFLLDSRGAVVRMMRGRLPAEVWDEIAELVLN
jgi:peroxiredoxin